MEFIRRKWNTIGVIAILLTGVGAAVSVARPHAVADGGLGAEWQCSRTLFIVTCSHSAR
jgi:hypothetical protein